MRSRTNHKFDASEENHLVIDEQPITEMHVPVALAHEAPAFALVEIGSPLFEFPLAPVLQSLVSLLSTSPCESARMPGVDSSAFSPEEFIIRTVWSLLNV